VSRSASDAGAIISNPAISSPDIPNMPVPTWGHAADLIDIMDVRPDGDGRFVSVVRGDHQRGVVEGSQMLGQAIVAAGRHAPERRVVSASMVFMRVADPSAPLVIELDELSSGRTFTTLAAHVRQDGRLIASGTLLADATAPDVIRHSAPPPDTAGPDESAPIDMAVTGRDIRVVDGAYTDRADAPVGPPVLDAWVRFGSVPDDPPLHAGLLAQFTGHMSIAAALRPHEGIGQEQAHVTLSTAPNAISISFHRDVRADRWMLYRHLSTFAGDGMTHSECRVHDVDGALVASFTVDAMVRGFAGGRVGDGRTSL
jgi:acyl-CoA thioesterase-2